MSFYYVISDEERSIWQGDAPSSASINGAFSALQVSGPNASDIRWVGPRARVTRTYDIGAARANVTRVANVLEISGNHTQAEADQAARVMAQALAGQLNAADGVLHGWGVASVQPFAEALNGPLSWWACTGTDQSQCAAVTLTENAWPEVGGRTQADENPIGPTTNLTHPATVGDVIHSTGSALTTAAWLVAGVLVVYLAWPFVVGAVATRAARTARRNPRRAKYRKRA